MPNHEKDPQDEILELFQKFQEAVRAKQPKAAAFCLLITPESHGSILLAGNDKSISKMLAAAIGSNIEAVKMMHHMIGIALEIYEPSTVADALRDPSHIIN